MSHKKNNKIPESKEFINEISSHRPIEPHDTAAWSNIEKTKPVSNVSQPSLIQTRNAKDWVDANQK